MKRIIFGVVFVLALMPSFLLAADYWLARYSGPAFMGVDIPNDITVDAEGNVYVTGRSNYGDWDTGLDYATVKYDADGNQLWVVRYTNGLTGCYYCEYTSESAEALAVDKDGNVYVTGHSGHDYVTIKYDRDGNQVWLAKYDSAGGRDGDRATDIAVDEAGNVYVTGG